MGLRRAQRGDTIVEVLIAIAVVGSVMAIAYSIMNRNLVTMRDNQERTEAVRLAQGQVEVLKAVGATSGGRDAINAQSSNGFCLMSGANPVVDLSGAAPTESAKDDDFSNYHENCVANELYRIGIRRTSGGAYRVTVRWDRSGGRERGEAIMVYRL